MRGLILAPGAAQDAPGLALASLPAQTIAQRPDVFAAEREVSANGLPRDATKLRRLKAMGFSDKRLSVLANLPETDIAALRQKLGVLPVYKRIDTCAAEFAAATPYMYSTYESQPYRTGH